MYEIERKFLIEKLPETEPEKIICIEQFYLSTDSNVVLRIRKYGEKFLLTLKSGNLNIRLEKEIEITENDFIDLKQFGVQNRILKNRYVYKYNNLKIEADVFEENLKGLLVAEVEFQSKEQCDEFVPPHWFGKEVTNDARFTNSYLSKTQKIPE